MDILIDDDEHEIEHSKTFDFSGHFHLLSELNELVLCAASAPLASSSTSSALLDDILTGNYVSSNAGNVTRQKGTRGRSYSLHSISAWTRVDPRIGTAMQSSSVTNDLCDEGYRYITLLSREECSQVSLGC
jgi:hypothetical protein